MSSVFWSTLIGSALGVVAGVFVQFLCQVVSDIFQDRRIRKSLGREFQFNLEVIDKVGQSFRLARDAFNAGTLPNYSAYFPLVEGLHVQSASLANSARLYDFFDSAQLSKLWKVNRYLSAENAQWYQSEIEKHKLALATRPSQAVTNAVVAFLVYCDQTVVDTRADLVALYKDFG